MEHTGNKPCWKNPKRSAITACLLVLVAGSLLRARSVMDHALTPSLKDHSAFWSAQGLSRNIEPYRRREAEDTEERVGIGGDKTLALVDPYLIGGFRNQHMRFVALVKHASLANITRILLPSLRWSNAGGVVAINSAVPHEVLFDVEHWNAHREVQVGASAGGAGVGTRLPSLVPFDTVQHGTCWDNFTGLFRNLNASLLRDPSFRPRRHDLMKHVDGCTRPYGYGSGFRAGRLWNDYISMQKGRPGLERDPIEIGIFRALQPSKTLQRVVDSFISRHPTREDKHGGRVRMPPEGSISADLLAVHPRVEVDMLGHKCARRMVKNLTALVGMMESSKLLNDPSSGMPLHKKIFLAISRSGMVANPKAAPLRGLAKENLFTLNSIVSHGLWNGSVPVLESGEGSAEGVVPHHASNVAGSVINFFIAVDAEAFLGTYGSSFSVDVWTVRYYMGRGDKNYVHNSDGIQRIPNSGIPRPHGYCK